MESGIHSVESGIHRHGIRNPESGIHSVESGIQDSLGLPYMGRFSCVNLMKYSMPGKNYGYEIYKEIKGEEEFNKKIEEANTAPPRRIFDDVRLYIEKEKIKFIFGAAALFSRKRPTHSIGIGAQGIATIVADPQFPECEFFIPGRSYPVCLRHATLKSMDDAGLNFLGASLRFADSDGASPLDILMSTGRSTVFFDAQGIFDAIEAYRSKNIKDYYLKRPDYLAANIEGLRRAPKSFFDQRYYSEIIFDFKAFDGVKRYVRFRLIPADGAPETGLLSEEDQRNVWDQKRLPTETRGKNYLREEFRKRLYEGSVKYKLQLTFHVPRSDDPAAILNVARYWDEATHPWLDVADVTINVFLSPDVTEKMRFNPGNLAPCLGLLPACSIHDSNCVVHIRKEVYERTQKLRALRDGSNYAPDQTAIYSISVQTAKHKKARTDARIFLSLTGTEGKTGMIPLASTWNDFKAGRSDKFAVEALDVGKVLMIRLHLSENCWIKNSDWFVERIIVTSSTQKKAFLFPCHRWVESDMVIFHGKAFLPFESQPEVIRVQRVLELQERQEKYLWGQLPAGIVNLPGFIKAPKHGDLPRNSQFSDEASGSFREGAQKGLFNLGLAYLCTLFNSWESLDSFKKLFTSCIKEAPKLSCGDLWMEDRVFGYQFLNGCNPCVIERCNKLPGNFPVTNDMVKNFFDRGWSNLDEEIKAGHVYIVDCKELEGIKRGGEDGYKSYAAEPICLFYAKSTGDLVPVAIQLFQQPSDTNPIWTPNDSEYDWLLAKMWFRNADHQVHQINTHLMKTHLIIEAFAVATWRQLPSVHPVFQFLFPHLRSVMAINTLGRNELIAEGGIIDKTLSVGGGGHIQLIEKTYKNFKFEMLSFPDMLKKRGVEDAGKLPNYYYRDDGLRIWNAITDFIVEFVNIFYHSDDDLSKDQELQSWAMDIHINGIPTREGDVDHGFLKNFQTRDQLVHVLTCIAFTCSCQHAAVNFPQMEITAFVPNVPPVMRLPPPTRKNEATIKMIMDTLPSKSQAGWHIATMHTLTRIANDEVFIGDYSQSLLTGEEVEGAISRFQSSLRKISEDIKQRNASLEFPYEYLLPERVPNSIAI
ncbi:allene oxide synthase-lipoxygenase protein-like [Montipora foliosa]|uniref:allene oxide synthase-lipoxygenase protein-like n=1 Tax=Montipora foliosa TaxID=591990 RepID=UPI0035F1C649